MGRRVWIVLGLALGGLALALVGRQQLAGGREMALPTAKQWDFDQGELRSLMDRTLQEQRAIIGAAGGEERARAERFRGYYEGRRRAIAQ